MDVNKLFNITLRNNLACRNIEFIVLSWIIFPILIISDKFRVFSSPLYYLFCLSILITLFLKAKGMWLLCYEPHIVDLYWQLSNCCCTIFIWKQVLVLLIYLVVFLCFVHLRPVSCVSNVDSLSRWIVCSCLSSSCVLRIQCWQFN